MTDEALAADAVAETPTLDELPVLGSMDDLLAEGTAGLPSIGRGDVLEGVIVRIEPDEILVDIGLKAEGFVPSDEVRQGTYSRAARASNFC